MKGLAESRLLNRNKEGNHPRLSLDKINSRMHLRSHHHSKMNRLPLIQLCHSNQAIKVSCQLKTWPNGCKSLSRRLQGLNRISHSNKSALIASGSKCMTNYRSLTRTHLKDQATLLLWEWEEVRDHCQAQESKSD